MLLRQLQQLVVLPPPQLAYSTSSQGSVGAALHDHCTPVHAAAAAAVAASAVAAASAGVQHVLPGVAVQRLLQTLLVQRVAHQADGAGHHEQRVQVADVHNLGGAGRDMA